MIWGVIKTFLDSFGKIFVKKSLNEAKISNSLFTFFGNFVSLIVALSFIFFGLWNPVYFTNFLFLALIIVSVSIFFLKFPMAWNIFKKEKFSIIAPFENMHKIIIIVVSFILFQNVSLLSFLITLLAVVVIVLFNLDLKTFRLPRNIKEITVWQLVQAVHTMVMVYIVSISNHINYFVFYIFFAFIVFVIILGRSREYTMLPSLSGEFYKHRSIGCVLGTVSHVINLFLINEFGIILTILLSFLAIVFTLFFSYLFFADKPSKKDIFQAILITGFVGLGYYFR